MIDKIILQCSILKLDNSYINKIKSFFNDEYLYFNFTEEDVLLYFKQNPLEGFENITEQYLSIKNGANRTDLFRYYFLFLNGGLVIDDDIMIYENINKYFLNYDYLVSQSCLSDHYYSPGLLGAKKGSEIIFKALSNLYRLDPNILLLNYFHSLKSLYSIFNKYKSLKIYIFKESRFIYFKNLGYDVIKDNYNNTIFRHFWGAKMILNFKFHIIENFGIFLLSKYLYKIYIVLKRIYFKIIQFHKKLHSFFYNFYYLFKLYNYNFKIIIIIINGPFKGIKYINNSTFGPLFPKLIGTYEEPIHRWIYDVINKNYKTIINIGSGEGYYAIGFSILLPKSNVFAFDIDKNAINSLYKLMKLNNLHNLYINQIINFSNLNNLITNSSLIFIDVEGNEFSYLSFDNIPNLIRADIIVEVHEFLIPGLVNILFNRFSNTHHIELIHDNNCRTIYPSLAHKFSKKFYKVLISEKRPSNMSWMFLKSKSV